MRFFLKEKTNREIKELGSLHKFRCGNTVSRFFVFLNLLKADPECFGQL